MAVKFVLWLIASIVSIILALITLDSATWGYMSQETSQQARAFIEWQHFGLKVEINFDLNKSSAGTVILILFWMLTGALAVTYMITGYFLFRMMMMLKKWTS
jgi:hypothetical protein